MALLRANLDEIVSDHSVFLDYVDQQARHIRSLIIAYGRRLQVLEFQQALKGLDTDPQIIIEIQDIRVELEKLYKQVRRSEIRSDFLIRRDDAG